MKNCFIFSGQGSHRPGMSANLYQKSSLAKKRIDLSNKILGYNISDIMFSSDEKELRKTQYAQVAIFIHSTIIFDILYDKFKPSIVAGHSLGEFSALYASKSYDFETGLKIVSIRAKAMAECEKKSLGKMSAVIGASKEKIEEVCIEANCQIANINSESQVVISGSEKSILLAKELFKAIGSKVIPLKVSGAFHSKLMSKAKPALSDIIHNSNFYNPICPIVSNYDGIARLNINDIKNALIQQIDSPVKWLKSVHELKKISSNFFEIGPKKVLGNIIKKIDDSLIITNYNCYEDL
jgi:[acyl-carrier-protein] S-malonyltransferase